MKGSSQFLLLKLGKSSVAFVLLHHENILPVTTTLTATEEQTELIWGIVDRSSIILE